MTLRSQQDLRPYCSRAQRLLPFYFCAILTCSSRFLALSTTAVFAFGISDAGLYTETWGDSLALWLALCGFLVFLYRPRSYKAFLLVTTFAALVAVTKMYLILPIVAGCLWLPVLIGFKAAIFRACLGIIFALVVIVVLDYAYPWYFWSTFIQYSSYLGVRSSHLFSEIYAFWSRFHTLIIITILVSSAVLTEKIGANSQSNRRDDYRRGLILFTFIFISICLLYIAQNTGRSKTYFVELFCLFCCLLFLSSANSINKRIGSSSNALGSSAIIVIGALLLIPHTNFFKLIFNTSFNAVMTSALAHDEDLKWHEKYWHNKKRYEVFPILKQDMSVALQMCFTHRGY